MRMKVWKNKDKCFKYVINVNCIKNTFDLSEEKTGIKLECNVKWKECELLLNTGFVDKEGKELYRHDIIEFKNGHEIERLLVLGSLLEWGLFVERQSPFKYVTVFRQEYLKGKKLIGNIYENPELILLNNSIL